MGRRDSSYFCHQKSMSVKLDVLTFELTLLDDSATMKTLLDIIGQLDAAGRKLVDDETARPQVAEITMSRCSECEC